MFWSPCSCILQCQISHDLLFMLHKQVTQVLHVTVIKGKGFFFIIICWFGFLFLSLRETSESEGSNVWIHPRKKWGIAMQLLGKGGGQGGRRPENNLLFHFGEKLWAKQSTPLGDRGNNSFFWNRRKAVRSLPEGKGRVKQLSKLY